MNLIKKIKRFNNNKVLKGSFELLLIVVSVFVASYAWFVKSVETKADDFIIKTKASRLLYISLDDGETWSTELNLNLDNFKFNNEVTSDGVKFYKAATKREDGTPITFKDAVAGSDYLEFDVLFKSNAALGIFLDSDSYIIPAAGTDADKLVGINSTRKSTYGEFSRDLIAGALRVSFTENSYMDNEYYAGDKASLVWAPNPSYELIYNKGLYTFDLESNNEQDYRYIDSSNGFEYKSIDNFRDELHTDFDSDMTNDDPMLTQIDPSYNGGIKSVTVRIWVEGNDRETHDALTGGNFKLNINFMGVLKEDNEKVPDVSVDGTTIKNLVLGMEYSTDNQDTWIKYEEDMDVTFTTGDVVYVRFSETDNYYASDSVKLEF